MSKKEFFISGLLFFFLTSILLWQMIFKGMYLFPGDYLLAWFEPYKSENYVNDNILISHKPVNDDVFRHIYPFRKLAGEMLRGGELPLWNPYNGAGMPLLATLNSGMLDPSNIFYFVFSYKTTWNITQFLQYVLIGVFTYLYSRSLRFSPIASVFSAVSYMLSGFVVARLSFGVYGFALAALPLLLYIIETYLRNFRTKSLFLIPIIFFFLITATQPPVAVYVFLFAGIYFLARLFAQSLPLQKKFFLLFVPVIFVILGIAVAAIQIFPTVELLHYANFNTQSSSYIDKFLVPIQHLVSIGIPNYFGNQATYNFWGQADYVQTVTAIGLIPCFFAYFFLFFGKETQNQPHIKKIYGFTILGSILLAVSSPISKFILTLPIPIISTDPPSRIFLLTTFAIAMLAGGGIDYFYKNSFSIREKIRAAWPFVAMLSIILAVTAYLYFTNAPCDKSEFIPCYQVALRNSILEFGIFAIALFAFFLSLRILKKYEKIVLTGFIVLAVFIIGFYNAQKFFPFSEKASVLPTSPFLDELKNKTTDARVFGFGDATIATNLATHFRFYDPQYYHPLYVKRYGELTAFGNYGTYEGHVLRSDAVIRKKVTISNEKEKRRERMLALLNVKYLIFQTNQNAQSLQENRIFWSDNFRYIQENKQALPRAFTVQKVLIERDNKEILKTLFSNDFDPATQVIVEDLLPFTSTTSQNIGNVTITSLKENSVTMRTQTSAESVLVLLDNYYPGWNAYVDKKKTPVFRADYTFRAIVLPKGDHVVKFAYEPDSVKWGIMVSAGSLFLLFVLFFAYPFLIKRVRSD